MTDKTPPSREELKKINRGFRVKIHVRQKSESWAFEFRWSIKRVGFRYNLKHNDLTEAKNLRALWENRIREKVVQAEQIAYETALSDFMTQFINYNVNRNLSPKYIETIDRVAKKFKTHVHNKQLELITSQDIQGYIDYELRSGRTPRGVHIDFRVLRTAFNWAKSCKLIVDNPIGDVKAPKLPRQVPRRFDMIDIRKIMSVIDREDHRCMVIVLVLTGLRIRELLNLRWSDIDFDHSRIIVTGKGGHEREVFIGSYLNEVLSGMPRNYDLVFPGRYGNVISYSRLRKRFHTYFEKAGVKLHGQGTFHRFRHTFGSMLGDAGRSSFELKQLLGHSSARTSEIYTYISQDVLRSAIDQLGEKFRTEIRAEDG